MQVIQILARLYLFSIAGLLIWFWVGAIEMFACQNAKGPAARQRYREERRLAVKIVLLSPFMPLWLIVRLFWTPSPRLS